MKYLLFFLLLFSCNYHSCQIGPNATVQSKIESKTNVESKSDTKNLFEQFKDLRDTLQPGAQFRCNF